MPPPGRFVLVDIVNEAVDSLHLVGPDGRPRAGWPITLSGAGLGYRFTLDGTLAAWWYEDLRPDTLDTQAARTKFTMIGPNGRTLPGLWPISSIGTATDPVVTRDGSLFYVSATGKVWGHDRTGKIIAGWPYRLSQRVTPELRPDGRLQFILGGYERGDGTTTDSQVIVLTTGRASGWPYRTSAFLEGVQCCVDCSSSYYPYATSADGTLYLAPWTKDRTEVVALDGRGRVVPGWPYRLPAGSRVLSLDAGSDGRIAVTSGDSCQSLCDSGAEREITLTAAGDRVP